MVYQKYVTRKGKKIGPYYYTSLRMPGGQVKSIYLGKSMTLEEAKLLEKTKFAEHKEAKPYTPKRGLGVREGRSPLSSNFITSLMIKKPEAEHHTHLLNLVLIAFVLIISIAAFSNMGSITSRELTGLIVFHDDTLYVVNHDNLVGRKYIETSNDVLVGKLVNSVRLDNITEGNIVNIKQITNSLPPEGIEFSEVYAFKNEVKADEATFKDSANGTIYRCEFFDYDSELCLSSWQIYLENVDGEFTAPIGESAFAIVGTAIQGEEFVLEEIVDEALTEIIATNITNVTQEEVSNVPQQENTLEDIDIKVVGSYCIYKEEKFTACQRTVWQGSSYAKGYITGGEPLKKSPEQKENEFIYCQELEKPGNKAVNAYLFNEKGKTIKTDLGTIVDCDLETTSFNETEFFEWQWSEKPETTANETNQSETNITDSNATITPENATTNTSGMLLIELQENEVPAEANVLKTLSPKTELEIEGDYYVGHIDAVSEEQVPDLDKIVPGLDITLEKPEKDAIAAQESNQTNATNDTEAALTLDFDIAKRLAYYVVMKPVDLNGSKEVYIRIDSKTNIQFPENDFMGMIIGFYDADNNMIQTQDINFNEAMVAKGADATGVEVLNATYLNGTAWNKIKLDLKITEEIEVSKISLGFRPNSDYADNEPVGNITIGGISIYGK